MTQTLDAIILGDGLIARTMAAALIHYNFRVLRVGAENPDYENDPRSYALAPSSLRLLTQLGLSWDHDQLNPVQAMEIEFGEVMTNNANRIADNQPMAMLDHRDMALGLAQHLQNQPFIIDADVELQFDDMGVFAPAHQQHAPLLIIADGKESQSARNLGISYRIHDFHQCAITAKLHLQKPHHSVARQLFTQSGPLAILPHQEHHASMVWSQDTAEAHALMAATNAHFLDALSQRLGGIYGAVECTHDRNLFPLASRHASRLIGENFVLIGDAAHTLHPMAGQGLNLGLRDVATLAECLRETRRLGLDIGGEYGLKKYAEWRAGDIAQLETLTRSLKHMTTGGLAKMTGHIANRALGQSAFTQRLLEFDAFEVDPMPELMR